MVCNHLAISILMSIDYEWGCTLNHDVYSAAALQVLVIRDTCMTAYNVPMYGTRMQHMTMYYQLLSVIFGTKGITSGLI
jgi:hypothetical protein